MHSFLASLKELQMSLCTRQHSLSGSVNSEVLCDFYWQTLHSTKCFRRCVDLKIRKHKRNLQHFEKLSCYNAILKTYLYLKKVMIFFLVCWFFFFIATYSVEYESKWKMGFKIFSVHFRGWEDKTVLLERQCETFRKWQLFNSILSTWHNKVKTLNFILLLSSTMSLQK